MAASGAKRPLDEISGPVENPSAGVLTAFGDPACLRDCRICATGADRGSATRRMTSPYRLRELDRVAFSALGDRNANRGDVPYRNAGVAERFGRANTLEARDALRDHLDADRADLSRAPERAENTARAFAPADMGRRDSTRADTTGVDPEQRIPDMARDADRRQPDRATMPPRNFDQLNGATRRTN